MTKRIPNLFLLVFALCVSTLSYAQHPKQVLKVKYVTTPVSPKVLGLLKTQVSDPKAYEKMVGLLSDYKFYYSLDIDTKSMLSVYSMDSVHSVAKVFVIGNPIASVKSQDNKFMSRENFTNSVYAFQGEAASLDWNITKETTEIAGYKCTKAILRNSPDVVVWFTSAIPVNNGPHYYYGLPGLVLKVQTYIDETVVSGISYSTDLRTFNTKYDKELSSLKTDKLLSMKEVTASKANFMHMVESKVKEQAK